MVRHIDDLNRLFLDIIIHGQLLTNTQISHIQLVQSATKLDLITAIIQAGIMDNELIIEILHDNNLLPLLTNQSKKVRILDYSRIDDYIKNGYFIYENNQNNKIIAVNDLQVLAPLLDISNFTKIALVKKKDFYQFFEKNFSHLNIIKSKYFLEFFSKSITAKNINYIKVIIIFFIIFFFILLNFISFFHIINNICYCLQSCLKMLLFVRAAVTKNIVLKKTSELILPIYTILLPLYKETGKLRAVIKNITNINYPKDKLDVKIIVEADDYLMIKEIMLQDLPSYIQLLKVPFSLPRTKPKALNYAMQYSKGDYLVIYDAEDRPEPDQLLKAITAFHTLSEEYVCVQAKLNFYNKDENLLTKLFSIEYSLWFEYILKGLSLLDLPITLGGTSNHFKTDILRKIGCWDAYNVTEDADLGIRLYACGYKVYMIDSYTLEESPIGLDNWIHQRSRWIKGFLQTFFVFLASKNKDTKFKFWQRMTIYIFVGLSPYSFYCLPFLIFTIVTNTIAIIDYLWLINSFFVFSYLYGSAFYIVVHSKGKVSNLQLLDIIALILWPFYFILHTIASYKAIWESMFRPFAWNKTRHGVSTIDFD